MVKHKLSIIVPAYNEEKRIERMLNSYLKFFDALEKNKRIDYEIIVVINNTRDKTEDVVKKFMEKSKNVSFLNFKKGGKGFAVKEGFKEALKRDSDLIGFVDADLATPPESFYFLVKKIGRFDGAIASRYLPESRITPAYNFRRAIVAKVFNFLVRSLFFIHLSDTQCGAKLFSRRAAEMIVKKVEMSQWAFDVELLYVLNKHGFVVRDFPTNWKDVGGSKIEIVKGSLQMFLSLIQLRMVHSPFRRLLRPLKPFIGLIWRVAYGGG
ncbi:MAG: glycosyltransferase [Nanoarchaeota archaeon]|nr:glycosyltransferase [Nanoarchaeota archaeon]MBU0977102.1 glycosyltransferase [Nanoarchaeota archaeon]